ncbi:heme oxygenase-like protein [Leucogyrophana mollusca]|uniref:Heme oxygenase-like protein n=1 Tax=Leucogyrophana mollusca TaxID=85980 RepID=A0ACB8BHV8_9AGAM|nr:heme oxygenase-like protein [Leucogyrophana mollusca]
MTSPTSPNKTSLTAHLLALRTQTPYAAATQHPFLTDAGRLVLPRARLSLWLSQDKIYAADAYPRFVALLIAKIPLGDGGPGDALHTYTNPDGSQIEESRNRRTLRILVGALQNIVREVGFFEDTAARWGLEIGGAGDAEGDWVERRGTRDYTAEMARVASLGTLEEGLVFLWAMEQAYLDAWRYVKSLLPPLPEAEAGQAIRSLTESWTNTAFVAFVDELAALADEYYGAAMDAGGSGSGNRSVARAEAIWARVIELEEAFWPNAGEETTARVSK